MGISTNGYNVDTFQNQIEDVAALYIKASLTSIDWVNMQTSSNF